MRDMQLMKEVLKHQVIPNYRRWWWKHWKRVLMILMVMGWTATLAAIGAVFWLAMFL